MRSFFLTREDTDVSHYGKPYDSIEWLFETILKEEDNGDYNYAVLWGPSEDSPNKIELYKEEPNFDTPADKIWYHDVKLKNCAMD